MEKSNFSFKPRGFWTLENCKKEAKRYMYKSEFRENSPSAYAAAFNHNWNGEICKHMDRKKRIYWTKEKCKEEAKKYKSRSEFKGKNGSAYSSARQNNWLEGICGHMTYIRKPNNYWNFGNCRNEANKYTNRNEFRKRASGAYGAARNNNWLEELCLHMLRKGNHYERAIYEIFDKKRRMTYIGLSYNPEKRYQAHLSSVKRAKANVSSCKKIVEGDHEFRVLTEYLPKETASIEEDKFIIKRENDGWEILNRAKGGALGGSKLLWTKEKCKEEAKKYKSRSEFKKKNGSAYYASLKNNWFEEITSHIPYLQNPSGYWDIEKCTKEAKKYRTRTEFQRGTAGAYQIARQNNWLEEICTHMTSPQKPNGFWDFKNCFEIAKEYRTRREFQYGAGGAYRSAMKNKWLDEICSHMEEIIKPNNYWTKERCKQEARKYNTKPEFRKKASSCGEMARRNGWFDEICTHMEEIKKPNNYWTKEKCKEEAKKYNTRTGFRLNVGGAYARAYKNGWLDEICKHMNY
jgi:hypothetical protein